MHDEEDADGDQQGDGNPQELFAVLDGEVEDGGVHLVVAGGVDVHPSKDDDGQVKADGEPVEPFLF